MTRNMKSSRVDIWRSLLYTLPTWLWIYAVLAHIAERCKIHVICTILLGCLCSVVNAVFNSGGHYTSQVWTFVQRSLFLSSLATGIFVAASRSSITFLRCLDREEVFRWSDNLKGSREIYCFFQTQLVKLLHTCQVSWGGIPRSSLAAAAPLPKHCQLCLCAFCTCHVWGHL